ncbi:hypothetical protein H5410_050387 [Solanum commersonii]|uniref:Uncharacterized protein n=1 Tax=Solanum commersonii TaxID=4109 RepID=A0A9J5WXQ5_SOLCO|nr:hypothetical protein H5410_050387 [Solanum commersonii]
MAVKEVGKEREFGDFRHGGGNGEKGEAIRYPWTSSKDPKRSSISSKRLLETGFKYKYGLEEMFDEAIECCKQRDIL